jgi:hypothetical protein
LLDQVGAFGLDSAGNGLFPFHALCGFRAGDGGVERPVTRLRRNRQERIDGISPNANRRWLVRHVRFD